MQKEDNRASESAAGMQHNTRAGCLVIQRKMSDSFPWWLVEQVAPYRLRLPHDPVAHRSFTRGSTQQQETQPAETTKIGKPRQRMQWSEEMNTFIMRQSYI